MSHGILSPCHNDPIKQEGPPLQSEEIQEIIVPCYFVFQVTRENKAEKWGNTISHGSLPPCQNDPMAQFQFGFLSELSNFIEGTTHAKWENTREKYPTLVCLLVEWYLVGRGTPGADITAVPLEFGPWSEWPDVTGGTSGKNYETLERNSPL